MKQLREEFESVCCERERLLSDRSINTLSETEMMEQMKTSISSLMEERDQLEQTLQGLREEVEQLRREQQERDQMVKMTTGKIELLILGYSHPKIASMHLHTDLKLHYT